MNIYDSSILSKAHTQYSNIIETLEADIVVGNADAYFDRGKVLIAAANPDLMEFYIEPHDLVILATAMSPSSAPSRWGPTASLCVRAQACP